MRVMHISSEDSVSSYTHLIKNQNKQHDVVLVLLKISKEERTSRYSIQEEGSRIIIQGVKEVLDYRYDQNLRSVCDELFKKHEPDVVHVHVFSRFSLLPILNTASSLGIKKILEFKDQLKKFSVLDYKRINYIVNQCDLIFCSSLKQKKMLDKLFGKNQRTCYVQDVNSQLESLYKNLQKDEGHRLFYKIGHLCNSKCLYCVAGEAIDQFIDLKDLKKELESKAADYDSITFTGGEPTLHPKFYELMTIAFYLGYKIEVQTNIRLFSSKRFTDKLRKFNIKVNVCINSSRQDVFDLIADAKGAFKQTVQGVRNVINAGIEIETKIVIVNYNFDHLREIVKFVQSLSIDSVMLVFPTPMGFAMKNFQQINPRYSDALPFVHEALEWGINNNMRMKTENIPGCLLNEKYHKYNSEYHSRQNTLDGIYLNVPKGLYNCKTERVEEQKQSVSGCKDCPYSYRCEGVYKEYVRNFGEEEFNPILTNI